jgi:hypothetical protein
MTDPDTIARLKPETALSILRDRTALWEHNPTVGKIGLTALEITGKSPQAQIVIEDTANEGHVISIEVPAGFAQRLNQGDGDALSQLERVVRAESN